MKLAGLTRLVEVKRNILSFVVGHKILTLVLLVVSISLIVFSGWAMKVRNDFIISMKSVPQDTSDKVYYSASPQLPTPNLNYLTSSSTSILGVTDVVNSSNVADNTTYSVPTLYPIMTQAPLPTMAPVATSTSSSPSSCAGTPTVDNSQAYVSSNSTPVNTAVTITIELRDCNNNFASVNDNLTVTLSNTDPNAKINGSSPPVTIQAQNGQATFSVNSSNAATDTFIISDTTRSFTVTMPGYHNPSVTFTNNNSGNSNCTTAAGVPNAWYSDVYPNPPVSTTTGSVTLVVYLRDCNKNTAPVSDTLTISLSSGDPNTQANGHNLPYSIAAQNGQANFTVTSQNSQTDTFVIQDTAGSFNVTDINNNNPSVIFSSSTTPTSTPTNTPVPTSSDTPTPTSSAPAATPTPTPAPTAVNTPVPSPPPKS